jgi:hypothetical protein
MNKGLVNLLFYKSLDLKKQGKTLAKQYFVLAMSIVVLKSIYQCPSVEADNDKKSKAFDV